MNELTQNQTAIAIQTETNGFLAVLSKAIENPNMNPEMFNRLLDVQERIMSKEAEVAFNLSFSKMINEIPVIAKTSEAKVTTKAGGGFAIKYASLDEIVEIIRPILSKYGFCVNFTHEQFYNGNTPLIRVTATLRHDRGHSIQNCLDLPHDGSGAKNAIQEIGSTVSYGKRYTLCSILNIATGDDRDGYAQKAGTEPQKLKFRSDWIPAAIQKINAKEHDLEWLLAEYSVSHDQVKMIKEGLINESN